MSKTYSIGCFQCQKHLWIAQGWDLAENSTLYVGEPHTVRALKAFLFEQCGHPLVFDDNRESKLANWDEIKVASDDLQR